MYLAEVVLAQPKPEPQKPLTTARQCIQEQARLLKFEMSVKISARCCDGLCVKHVAEDCGKGLFATKCFLKGDYICVYTGDMLTERQFRAKYAEVSLERCYTFHFQHDSRNLVVDATNVCSFARMANHSWKKFNAEMRRCVVNGVPYVVMFAAQDIKVGHEIRYNYGDKIVRESGDKYVWLKEIKDYN